MAPFKPVSHVAIINKSALPPNELALMVECYRGQLSEICASWALPIPGLAIYTAQHVQQITEEAALIFVDSANDPDAFGYHTVLGLSRFGYIDISLCHEYGEPISRVFGHELYELMVDPDCDRWAGPFADGYHYAVEVCDAVQRCGVSVEIVDPLFGTGTAEIADWCKPSWYDAKGRGPWSALGNAPGPLALADGGYMIREKDGRMLAGGETKSFGRTARRLMKRRG